MALVLAASIAAMGDVHAGDFGGPRPALGESPLVRVSERGECIYRCRIFREECVQDTSGSTASRDACWDSYRSCRGACGNGEPDGTVRAPSQRDPTVFRSTTPAPAPDHVELTPDVIGVGKWAEGIAFDGNWIWIAESGQRTVARIDLGARRVVDRFRVGRLPVDMASTGEGDVYAMVATDKRIWKRTGRGQGATLANLGECPEAMIGFGQQLWILTLPDCSSASSRLVRIDPQTGKRAQTGILGEWGQALVGYDTSIWIAHVRAPAITLVDNRSLRARAINVAGASFWSIAANSRSVFAGGREGDDNARGLVVMFDAISQSEVSRLRLPERVANIVADERHVVAIGGSGQIWVLDADTLALKRTVSLTTGGFKPRDAMLHLDDLLISVGQFRGENGALLSVSNWQPGDGPAATDGVLVQPSFDCSGARKPAEQAICTNRSLAAMDRELASEYTLAITNITSAAVGGTAADVARFRGEQADWLRGRNRCEGDVACLIAAYRARLEVLRENNKPE